jgi:hypothetical protein
MTQVSDPARSSRAHASDNSIYQEVNNKTLQIQSAVQDSRFHCKPHHHSDGSGKG